MLLALSSACSLYGQTTQAPSRPPASYYSSGRVETHLDPSRGRRQVVIGLPSANQGVGGELWVQPSVDIFSDRSADGAQIAGPYGLGTLVTSPVPFDPTTIDGPSPTLEQLPMPSGQPAPSYLESEYLPGEGDDLATPIFEDLLIPGDGGHHGGFFHGLLCEECASGIGRERVMHAPFEIDTTQPFGNFAVKTLMYTGQQLPDRAEFFWSRAGGRGPALPETLVNFQEVRLKLELGKGKFSTTTEVPFRWVDPERNRNHSGLGDLTTATKTVLLDGESWQITQFFKTYFNTGSPSMGLGTGHISLEPGFLFRYRWSESTYLHSEVKYLFPLGADPLFAGEVLRYGLGISHLWLENDEIAILPTFEFVGWSISGGQATNPLGVPIQTDGTHIFNVYPGLRIVHDTNSDLGLLEIGVRGGFPVSPHRWQDGSVGVELRWSF